MSDAHHSATSEQDVSRHGSVRGRWLSRRTWVTLVVLAAILAAGWWWISRSRTSTDNARIEGPVHAISSRVDGLVVEVFAELNQSVGTGDPLFRIDPRDFEVNLARAQAELASAQAELAVASSTVPVGSTEATSGQVQARVQETNAAAAERAARRGERLAEANLRAAQAALASAQARAERAEDDLARLRPLADKQQVARQELESARSQAAAARAQAQQQEALVEAAGEELEIARSRRAISRGQLQQARAARTAADTAPEKVAGFEARLQLAEARLLLAEAALERARLDLEDTTVRAPVAGVIGRKDVEVGQMVRRGQAVMALVGHDVWVEANFKETQVRDMAPGQAATVQVDAYPGTLRGVVHSIGPATGSRFSLLPADNTSGNFVKVVQRVPVKITFDPEELRRHHQGHGEQTQRPLRPGMSVEVTVDLSSPRD